jgi:CRP-like cAMP-binding protein
MALRSTDEMLARVPMFAGLSTSQLRDISRLATRLDLPAGRQLTTQGAVGQEFLIVLDGDVEVVLDGVVVATPTAGQCYGEIALLDRRPRTASVVATTDVIVDVIGRREFRELLKMQPPIAEQLQITMAERLAANEDHKGRTP